MQFHCPQRAVDTIKLGIRVERRWRVAVPVSSPPIRFLRLHASRPPRTPQHHSPAFVSTHSATAPLSPAAPHIPSPTTLFPFEMSHSCAATMILSQFDCLVCDRFYDAINTMRAQMDWEPIDWFMDLTAAEIQFEFERLLVKLYSEHLPTVLILSESPVSETYDAIFDSVMDSDALDTCSTECGVPASHSDVVESQIYRPRVIEFGVTFQVLLPHGTVCNVREIPPKTGCGSPARSVDELARSEDSEDESAAAEVPQDDLWQLDDSTLEYESQLDEESGQGTHWMSFASFACC